MENYSYAQSKSPKEYKQTKSTNILKGQYNKTKMDLLAI